VKRRWVVGAIKMWVNLFNFCWRCVNMFGRWVNLSFSPTSFSKIVIFTHFLFRFTHLQISSTCRFHLPVDFIYLHLSSVTISVVYVRLHVIFTHFFLSPAVPHKLNGDNQAQEPGWEGWKKGFCKRQRPCTPARSLKKKKENKCQENPDIYESKGKDPST